MNPLFDVALCRSTPAYYTAVSTAKLELVGARPLHLAYARPFGRLKAPLGLSLLASLRKREQRSFCSAQNPASFGVKLAYGGITAGNRRKQKARNFSVHQEVSGFALLKLELVGARPLHLAGARPLGRLKAPLGLSLLRKRGIHCSIGFIVGNSSTSRMEALSVSSMTRRSTPKPRPPVGGRPYSRALT